MTTATQVSHPATFSKPVLAKMKELVEAENLVYAMVLDPFAGVGTIHELDDVNVSTFGVELEPEWADRHPFTDTGDATDLPYLDQTFHIIATSPSYANRVNDPYLPQPGDTSRRYNYTASLGRHLSPGNSGGMKWGQDYCDLHVAAWEEAYRVLRPGGALFLNIKNHYRSAESMTLWQWNMCADYSGLYFATEGGGRQLRSRMIEAGESSIEQPVVQWHTQALVDAGFTFEKTSMLYDSTGIGGSGPTRYEVPELILTFRKGV